jgi:hypothetical protein
MHGFEVGGKGSRSVLGDISKWGKMHPVFLKWSIDDTF